MFLLKILGGIDLVGGILFLMIIFNLNPFLQLILFAAGLLFLKSLFIFSGDVLSVVDILAATILILSLFFTLPTAIIWIPALFLLAKGFVSFL